MERREALTQETVCYRGSDQKQPALVCDIEVLRIMEQFVFLVDDPTLSL